MSIPLDKFINNLEQFNKNPIKVIDKKLKEMVFLILHQISEYVVDDTGHARSLVIKKFADKYGFSTSDLENAYDFWDAYYGTNSGRDWDGVGSTLTESITNKSYNVDITAEDDALHSQEYDPNYKPSDFHSMYTGRDNSQFIKHPIDFISFYVTKEAFNEVAGLEAKIDELIKEVDDFLFK